MKVRYSFEPTYEELKLAYANKIKEKTHSFEPTYEELKPLFTNHQSQVTRFLAYL